MLDKKEIITILDWYIHVYENDSMEWPNTEQIYEAYILYLEQKNIKTLKRCDDCGKWNCNCETKKI